MIRVLFSPEDLSRVRLALHPLGELTEACDLLRGPGWRSAPFAAWSREARAALHGLDLGLLQALLGDGNHAPDFLAPPPTQPLPDFRAQLLQVVRADPDLVRREITEAIHLKQGHDPGEVAPFLSRPGEALEQLADLLAVCWNRTLAPHWPLVRALLEADLAYRAYRLATEGLDGLFSDLHPTLRFEDGCLTIHSRRPSREVQLEGRGLVLVPSAFRWFAVMWTFVPPWRPMIVYPARGAFGLWQGRHDAEDAVVVLLGRGRAQLLRRLASPRTTSDLATTLGVTLGAVSQQVGALRRAGLVEDRRSGRHVYHLLSPRGEALLRALET